VGLAIHGDMLRYADPLWVARLARGARYMLAGLIVSVVIGLLSTCLTWFAPGGVPVSRLGDFFGSLLGLYGAWVLTSRDPSGIGEDSYVTARRIVRAGLAAGLAQQLLVIGFCGISNPPLVAIILLTVLGISVAVLWIVAEFAKFRYIERLACRIPDAAIATRARIIRWGLAITFSMALVVGGLLTILVLRAPANRPAGVAARSSVVVGIAGSGSLAPGRFLPPQAVASRIIPTTALPGYVVLLTAVFLVPAGIAMLVFWVLTFLLLSEFAERCREQAGVSRETWGPAPEA
jgi:hypothetical protein